MYSTTDPNTTSTHQDCISPNSLARLSIRELLHYLNASMYSTTVPSRATFNPKINVARMPSPPTPLRPLVNRLNRTPTRVSRSKAAPQIKTEPLCTPELEHRTSQILATVPPFQPGPNNNISSNGVAVPTPSATISSDPNDSALTQALADFLNTPPLKRAVSVNDLQGCKVEIHFHVHPTVRPTFPLLRPNREGTKRKRGDEGEQGGQGGDDRDLYERKAKKMKLSHGHEPGFHARGQRHMGGRGERTDVAAGVKTRSRQDSRRKSTRWLEAGRR